MHECPTGAVDLDTWATIDLFWACHQRTPGMASATAVRVGLPRVGAVLDQDNWMMWAFDLLQHEYLVMQSEAESDKAHAKDVMDLQSKMAQHGAR